MHTIDLLAEATALAESLGYGIRQEWLGGAAGGACEIAGRRWLFIDMALNPVEQLEQAALDMVNDARAEVGQQHLPRSRRLNYAFQCGCITDIRVFCATCQQQLAHADADLAEINIHRTGIFTLGAHGAFPGPVGVLEFIFETEYRHSHNFSGVEAINTGNRAGAGACPAGKAGVGPIGVGVDRLLGEPERHRLWLVPSLRLKLSNLSEFMREIKVNFARFYNRRHHRRGYFWGDRFKGVIVENGETLI